MKGQVTVMQFLRKLSILLFLLSQLLTGTVCAQGSGLNMITQVKIVCRKENTTVTRRYVQPHKIQAVLNYLRLLKCSGRTDTDPEQLAGDSFEIALYDARGQRTIYRQRANRFFSKNAQPWKRISPEQASLLYNLISSIPSDKLIYEGLLPLRQ